MSRTEVRIAASPEAVFAFLATPESYVDWEVGSSAVHASDPDWPAVGALFEHSHGIWLLQQRDTTKVLEVDPPKRIVLEARLRPWIVARVDFRLEAVDSGTRVTVIEQPVGGVARLVRNPVLDQLLGLRNREMLRRLRNLAEAEADGSG